MQITYKGITIEVEDEAFKRVVSAGRNRLMSLKLTEGPSFPPTDRDALDAAITIEIKMSLQDTKLQVQSET